MRANLLLILLGVLITASCATTFDETGDPGHDNLLKDNIVGPKLQTYSDSVDVARYLQSNYDCIVLSQVVVVNGQYVLQLSKKDADELGIPAEIYDKYDKYVTTHNSSMK